MNRVFIGYDYRQPVSYNVLQQSILNTAIKPFSVTPLVLSQLPITRQGLTPFTYSRFLVPWLCNYEGWGLFLDIDILVRHDISELFALANPDYAVMVSKNEHKFEWASVILFNCAHPANKMLTPSFVQTGNALHQISWLDDSLIGDLPREWNHLVGYDEPREHAKLVHYTQGVPCFPETQDSEYSEDWHLTHKNINSTLPWVDLMGTSVHACDINGRKMPKYHLKKQAKSA